MTVVPNETHPKEWRCMSGPDGLVHVVEFTYGQGPTLYCAPMTRAFIVNRVWVESIETTPTCIECAAWWNP